MTSIFTARNTLYPASKIYGNTYNGRQLVLFTSAHGHYSIEKAAQACGFGSAAVIPVPVDPVMGSMLPSALESLILTAKSQGKTPFYINATAGTTVLGSFAPFSEVRAIARKYGIWFHVDASWGGAFIFSDGLRHKLRGTELADSVAINPHKMMGVPITCSFLLVKDLRQLHGANTLPAGNLFHGREDGDVLNNTIGSLDHEPGGDSSSDEGENVWEEPDDMADLTLQCGRRGDSLKLLLSWQYYGSAGYAAQIENAYVTATNLAKLVETHSDVILVSENPPPCLQLCFFCAPGGRMVFGNGKDQIAIPVQGGSEAARAKVMGRDNSMVTERITRALVARGFMIDFAPSLEGREAEGKFFRVVVNVQTVSEAAERLVKDIVDLGMQVKEQLRQAYSERWGGDVTDGVVGPVVRRKDPAERDHGPVIRQCHSYSCSTFAKTRE